MKTFARDGVSFRFPPGWTLDVDDGGSGWTASVHSPDTAFVTVTLQPDAESAGAVAAEALAVLRAEYPTLDAEPVTDTLAGGPAVGHDIDLLTLDCTVSVWTRAIDTTAGPLLVLLQVTEFDRDQHEPALRAVLASVSLDD